MASEYASCSLLKSSNVFGQVLTPGYLSSNDRFMSRDPGLSFMRWLAGERVDVFQFVLALFLSLIHI